MTETLQGEGPFTLFAPTNAAFTYFGDSLGLPVDALFQVDGLADLLLNHVVDGIMTYDFSKLTRQQRSFIRVLYELKPT